MQANPLEICLRIPPVKTRRLFSIFLPEWWRWYMLLLLLASLLMSPARATMPILGLSILCLCCLLSNMHTFYDILFRLFTSLLVESVFHFFYRWLTKILWFRILYRAATKSVGVWGCFLQWLNNSACVSCRHLWRRSVRRRRNCTFQWGNMQLRCNAGSNIG